MTEFQPISNLKADCQIVGFFEESPPSLPFIPSNMHNHCFFQDDNTLKLFVHCGKKDGFSASSLEKCTDIAISAINQTTIKSVSLHFDKPQGMTDMRFCHILAKQVLATQTSATSLKSDEKPINKLQNVGLSIFDENAIKSAQALNMGLTLTKSLGDMPANICTPTYLADAAKELESYANTHVKILEEDEMASLGMNAFLSVSKGSKQPAKLIEIRYQGGKENDAPYVFVGKGITFDSGGISLKPAAGMGEMKYDMCGAASVIGLMKSINEYNLPLNVVGLVAASENLPSGEASKPSDVVTSMSGKTIEILNTDAEGRLVLCDTLTYAKQFKPKTVIDIATLTGAMIIALGHITNGLMGNNDTLCQKLIKAGNDANDKAWQLPINEEYQSLIDSNIADICNIGADRSAGSITAACFLARFCEDFEWVHIDCAGTAWVTGKNKAATGRPLPLLFQYLLNEVN